MGLANAWAALEVGVRRFDSSALAVLLECRRAALARGLTLALDHLPAGLHSMAQLYGVLPLLVAPTATNEPA